MKTVFFYCDSQANILTSYFMKKMYYDKYYKSVLLVDSQSNNTIECARRASEYKIWDEVEVVDSKIKMQTYFDRLAKNDKVFVYALQNEMAREFFAYAKDKCYAAIVDEGVLIFNEFLALQKNDEKLQIVDVQKSTVEAWCYEPQVVDLPSNVNVNKIGLQDFLNKVDDLHELKKEIKTLFDIKPLTEQEKKSRIIYFDQYFTLCGRTSPEVEKYFLKKIEYLCGNETMLIKPHPMERGFNNKYEWMNSNIYSNQVAPWEAIYFVNFYHEEMKPDIYISGESMSLATPLIMFGDENYVIINLMNICRKIYGKPAWKVSEYAERVCKYAEKASKKMFFPEDFCELDELLQILIPNRNVDEKKIKKYDMDKMMEWAKLLKNNQTNLIQCSLQIVDGKNGIESYTEPQILNGENFCIKYSFLGKKIDASSTFRWNPCGRCFLALKDVSITAKYVNNKTNISNDIVAEQATEKIEDEFEKNIFYYPSYVFYLPEGELNSIEIVGKWKFDFDVNRLVDCIEKNQNVYVEQSRLQIIHLEHSSKYIQNELMEKNKLLENSEEMNRKLMEKNKLLENSEEMNRKMENYLQTLYNSWFWKITYPIRKFLKVDCFDK